MHVKNKLMYLNKIIIKHNHPSRYQYEITWSQLKIDQNIEFDMEFGGGK